MFYPSPYLNAPEMAFLRSVFALVAFFVEVSSIPSSRANRPFPEISTILQA